MRLVLLPNWHPSQVLPECRGRRQQVAFLSMKLISSAFLVGGSDCRAALRPEHVPRYCLGISAVVACGGSFDQHSDASSLRFLKIDLRHRYDS